MDAMRVRDGQFLDAYATKAARLKGCEDNIEVVRAHLEATFLRVYRAVAFDIDGTLTAPDDTAIDPDAAAAVANLLQRGVHVILITGRGTRSAIAAADQIRTLARLGDWYTRRLYCVVENGVALLSTPTDAPHRFMANRHDLTPPVDGLDMLADHVADWLRAFKVNVKPKSNSVRVVLAMEANLASIEDFIRQALTDSAWASLYVSRGRYATTDSLSICNTNKRQAIERVAGLLGLSQEHIVRIGDQGREGGNDFELLDSPAGFSVGDFSKRPDGCFPVFSEDFSRLEKAAAATRRLADLLYLFPTIALEPTAMPQYREALLHFEKLASRRSRDETRVMTDRLRIRLKYLVGAAADADDLANMEVSDIYDPLSGAVFFRDWETIAVQEDPAFALFTARLDREILDENAPCFGWAMFSDTAQLLRGPNYYYALTKRPGEASTREYAGIVETLMTETRTALDSLAIAEPSLPRFKLLAAYLDNLRNAFITTEYAILCSDQRTSDYALTCEFYQQVLRPHTDIHRRLLLDADLSWQIGISLLHGFLDRARHSIARAIERLQSWRKEEQRDIFGKEILRKWRECDHFLQNIAALQLGLYEFDQRLSFGGVSRLTALGLVYGATELPAIAQAVAAARGFELDAAYAAVSLYGRPEIGKRVREGDARYVQDFLSDSSKVIFLDPERTVDGSSVLLLDDNLTTGTTMQLARDLLVANGGDVLGAIVVRFPSANRTMQMAMPGHGVPNPDLMFGFIRGLVAPSPYSRLLFEGRGYRDATDTFNKARLRVERHLEKNGGFVDRKEAQPKSA